MAVSYTTEDSTLLCGYLMSAGNNLFAVWISWRVLKITLQENECNEEKHFLDFGKDCSGRVFSV